MAFTESLLLQKGHFHSSERGCSFNKYFFVLKMWHFSPEKRALFSLLKKWGGGTFPIAPSPCFCGPWSDDFTVMSKSPDIRGRELKICDRKC